MSWGLASAAVLAGTTYMSGQSAKSSAIRNLNATSKAEGEAVVKERLNYTISNSYRTAMAQMQLSLQKRQLAQQGSDIRAATLAAQGNQDVLTGATGSIGASVSAVSSDIRMKSEQALAQTDAAYEQAVENYNTDLQMMVINTEQSEQTIRKPEYLGPSNGEILGGALMAGLTSYASSYALNSAKLGLGAKAPTNVPSVSGTQFSGPLGSGLYNPPNIFSIGGFGR